MRVFTAEAGYTVTGMADEQSTEIFDDLYLGLRAGERCASSGVVSR